MFHLVGYRAALGVNALNTDMSAIADPIFSQRNNHFIFSEDLQIVGAAHIAVSATDARFNIPSLNATSRHHVFPVNRSATPPSYPRIDDYRAVPIIIPQNEELAIEGSNNLGAATEETSHHLWIAPKNWNMNLPPAPNVGQRLTLRFTSAIARVAQAWSGPGAITFEQTPRGGWYCVNCCYLQTTTCRAFRLFFPRAVEFYGRILRPGSLVQNALGDLIYPNWVESLGEWGRFHTFEPPQIEVHADAGGADTQIGFMDVTYLGTSPSY